MKKALYVSDGIKCFFVDGQNSWELENRFKSQISEFTGFASTLMKTLVYNYFV